MILFMVQNMPAPIPGSTPLSVRIVLVSPQVVRAWMGVQFHLRGAA